ARQAIRERAWFEEQRQDPRPVGDETGRAIDAQGGKYRQRVTARGDGLHVEPLAPARQQTLYVAPGPEDDAMRGQYGEAGILRRYDEREHAIRRRVLQRVSARRFVAVMAVGDVQRGRGKGEARRVTNDPEANPTPFNSAVASGLADDAAATAFASARS